MSLSLRKKVSIHVVIHTQPFTQPSTKDEKWQLYTMFVCIINIKCVICK